MSESGIVWKPCVSQKVPNCSNEQVDKYLQKNETYSKCKQSRKNSLCLKVQTFRLNEIWSVDLADMQQLARPNNGVNFLFVAVDTLSRFLWVRPIKRKTADSCRNALKQITSDIKDESPKMQCSHFFNVLPEVPLQCPESWKKFGWTRAENWLEKLHHSARTQPLICNQQTVKQSQHLLSEIFAR